MCRLAVLSLLLCGSVYAAPDMALITQDNSVLRAAPRDAASQQAALWQGELVEIRGQRMDYVQVYDYHRERGGFIHQSQLRRTQLAENEAAEFLAVLRHLRELPGSEALGFGYAAAYLKIAPGAELRGSNGSEVFSAIGTMAERLAQRSSNNNSPKLLAHIDVAARYGIKFTSVERNGQMLLCYDGEAYRYVLNGASSATQRAQAALALTRSDCQNSHSPRELYAFNEQYAATLDKVDSKALPDYLKNRIAMRRANVWSSLAYQQARQGNNPVAAANRALNELASINKNELPDNDLALYNDSIMRVNASRWAVLPNSSNLVGINLVTSPGQPGETCISLMEGKQEHLKRCTYSQVWLNSASLNREKNALTLAVQPSDSWREMWLFHKTAQGWNVQVLPPGASNPDTGYIEFAGWVPSGKQVIVARELRSEGKYKRSYEVLEMDSGRVVQQANSAELLAALKRWADVGWRNGSVR